MPHFNDLLDQNHSLPHHIFRNIFTWGCYEMFKHYLPWAISLLCFVPGCILMTQATTIDSFNLGFVSGVFFGLSLLVPLPVFNCMKSRTISQNKLSLAEVILDINPGINTKQWDKVAYEFNKILQNENNWNTPSFFFNGLHCFDIFRSYIVIPFYQDKLNESEEKLIQVTVNQYQQAINSAFMAFLEEGLPELPSRSKSPPSFCRQPEMSFLITYLPRAVSILLLILSGYYLIKTYRNSWLIFPSAYFFVFAYIVDKSLSKVNMVSLMRSKLYSKLHVESRLKFLAAVVRVRPGGDLDAWHKIANCMNQYLHDEGVWKNENEKFSDGRSCLNFFTTDLKPLIPGHNSSRYPELRDIVIEAVNMCESG